MKLLRLKKTCEACPSQWEGELEDGRFIYIRFRWGNLGFGIGETIKDAIKNYDYGNDVGNDPLNGALLDNAAEWFGLEEEE